MGIENRQKRLLQVMELAERGAIGLRRSRARVFDQQVIDVVWVESIELTPEHEDMLESFISKFNRFQDMLGDKVLPALLDWKGEHCGAFVDNLNRAERLGWVVSAHGWFEARALRNKLVHEYMVDVDVFTQSLHLANELSIMLLDTWQNIQEEVNAKDALK